PDTDGDVPDDGRQPEVVLRLACMGVRAAQERGRQRLRDVLAARAYLVPLAPASGHFQARRTRPWPLCPKPLQMHHFVPGTWACNSGVRDRPRGTCLSRPLVVD